MSELCAGCKSPLTKTKQIYRSKLKRKKVYCSYGCYQRFSNFGSLQEPLNQRQAEEFFKEIEERKREVTTPEEQLVRAQTPYDDSPEAERQMREAICPNPPAYVFASTGTTNGL